jgi:hypothetical protein
LDRLAVNEVGQRLGRRRSRLPRAVIAGLQPVRRIDSEQANALSILLERVAVDHDSLSGTRGRQACRYDQKHQPCELHSASGFTGGDISGQYDRIGTGEANAGCDRILSIAGG